MWLVLRTFMAVLDPGPLDQVQAELSQAMCPVVQVHCCGTGVYCVGVQISMEPVPGTQGLITETPANWGWVTQQWH